MGWGAAALCSRGGIRNAERNCCAIYLVVKKQALLLRPTLNYRHILHKVQKSLVDKHKQQRAQKGPQGVYPRINEHTPAPIEGQ